MKPSQTTPIIHATLAMLVLVIALWQRAEHQRVESNLRESLINRSRDLSTSLAIVMSSQRRFGGFVVKTRLESALESLLKTHELQAVVLYSRSRQIIAQAGETESSDSSIALDEGVHWQDDRVSLFNLVDLGVASTNGPSGPAIVMDPPEQDSNEDPRQRMDRLRRQFRESQPEEERSDEEERERRNRARFGRPPWMDEADYTELQEKQGVHGFLIQMSTHPLQSSLLQDATNRTIIVIFASLAAIAAAMARRFVSKSSDVELRLIRASEQNSHLREMNMAAAGLAHETRNPLNLIRGKAQMISNQQELPEDVQNQCQEIASEVDRVTAQLNEFINYSKPRDVKRTAVKLNQILDDILRTLKTEMNDQDIKLEYTASQLEIEADEKMLRQVLFNLLLNALQAQPDGGFIKISEGRDEDGMVYMEICDAGPGIDPDQNDSVFEPYFTSREGGTGLGLAIVKQIVMAHGWTIRCMPGSKGAHFRISQIKSLSFN